METLKHTTAARYIATLTGHADTPCTWQLFDDRKPVREGMARVLHGPLWRVGGALSARNREGVGVFCTVNETDLHGRKAANVVRIRALFVEFDGPAPTSFHLPPSMIVRSRNGLHVYWCVADCELADFRSAQKRLIRLYGSDPVVHDLPRVLRVPGFAHCKADPFMVELVAAEGHRYTTTQVLADVPAEPVAPIRQPRPAPLPSTAQGLVDWHSIDAVSLFRDSGLYRRAMGGGRHAVVCPWEGEHSSPDFGGDSGNTSSVVWDTSPGGPTFLCSHSHCSGRGLFAAMTVLGQPVPRRQRERA